MTEDVCRITARGRLLTLHVVRSNPAHNSFPKSSSHDSNPCWGCSLWIEAVSAGDGDTASARQEGQAHKWGSPLGSICWDLGHMETLFFLVKARVFSSPSAILLLCKGDVTSSGDSCCLWAASLGNTTKGFVFRLFLNHLCHHSGRDSMSEGMMDTLV